MNASTHRLFFAVRLDEVAQVAATEAAEHRLAASKQPKGRVAALRLHITLHDLGEHPEVPSALRDAAWRAGAAVDLDPFDIAFDRIGSYGPPGTGGLALTASQPRPALRKLQRAVGAAMAAVGLQANVRKRFQPHVSLVFCHQPFDAAPVRPICWRVDELLLIDSWVGRSVHTEVGQWPLASRQRSFSDW